MCVCVCVLQVKVNFPMPPALQMLQDLLGGDSSSEEDEVPNKPESGVCYRGNSLCVYLCMGKLEILTAK